ncbi:MAG: hypothetical protein NZ561_00690 [Phycisphaerae bacterium]|nr:hypothetical protein [Phycisphaerae bacterium]MDW8261047.1 hypothetical protein [Phycisphaerales bacterium]
MELNFFTVACLLSLSMVPGIYLLGGGRSQAEGGFWRFAVAVAVGVTGFALVGSALMQGPGDQPLPIDPAYLLARRFDTAALHYATLVAVICALLAAGANRLSLGWLAMTALMLGAVALPVAMKALWLGPMMRLGVIDIGGASVQAAGAACVLAVSAGLPSCRREPDQDAPPSWAVGMILLLMGWVAYLFASGVMRSPATVVEGALNCLRASAVAAAVAVLVERIRGNRHPARSIAAGILLALVTIAPAAGRAPGVVVMAVGVLAPLVAPAMRRFCAQRFGVVDGAGIISAHLFGAIFGMTLATPFAVSIESLRIQLSLQMLAVTLALGLGAAMGLPVSMIARIFRRRGAPAGARA